MTEEIIIDCAFYKDGVCASPINKTCEYCKNIDVSKCYHKQLKRLEQECDELKEKYFLVEQESIVKSNTICELKQENIRLFNESIELRAKNIEYKSALEEIKSIADKFDYWNNNLTDASNVINGIKDKINEVI